MIKARNNTTVVKFKSKMGVYCIGEVAGFTEVVAQRLVDAGYVDVIEHSRVEKPTPSPTTLVTEDEEDEEEEKQMTSEKRGRGRPKKDYVTK